MNTAETHKKARRRRRSGFALKKAKGKRICWRAQAQIILPVSFHFHTQLCPKKNEKKGEEKKEVQKRSTCNSLTFLLGFDIFQLCLIFCWRGRSRSRKQHRKYNINTAGFLDAHAEVDRIAEREEQNSWMDIPSEWTYSHHLSIRPQPNNSSISHPEVIIWSIVIEMRVAMISRFYFGQTSTARQHQHQQFHRENQWKKQTKWRKEKKLHQ